MRVKVLRNQDVKFLAAFIPKGHRHTRIYINLGDEILILQQATVDALIRAYALVTLHPKRTGIGLRIRRLSKYERKEGFAEYQLLEVNIDENRLINSLSKVYDKYVQGHD